MGTLRAMFDLPVGLSDHSEGIAVPIAAAALGAVVIEKHLTLDRSLGGPDHKASIEPDELARMVAGIRAVEQALGLGRQGPAFRPNSRTGRLRANRWWPLARFEQVRRSRPKDLTAMRPGTGVSPMEYWSIVGSIADRSYRAGELIEWPSRNTRARGGKGLCQSYSERREFTNRLKTANDLRRGGPKAL